MKLGAFLKLLEEFFFEFLSKMSASTKNGNASILLNAVSKTWG